MRLGLFRSTHLIRHAGGAPERPGANGAVSVVCLLIFQGTLEVDEFFAYDQGMHHEPLKMKVQAVQNVAPKAEKRRYE